MPDRSTRLSPGSADVPMLDSVSKPMEMSSAFSHPQDLAGLDLDASLHTPPFPGGRDQAACSKPPEVASLLFDWYSGNDGPWTGLDSTRVGHVRAHPNPNLFLQYRDNVVPSECSTTILPQSDSGYGSFAKQSVANNSVCDESFERNTETQSVIGHLSDFQLGPSFAAPDTLPRNGLEHANSWQLPQGTPKYGDHASQANGSKIVCKTCNKVLKTNSELKKHTQRHTKPYRCDVLNCARREGFSTSNDLDRHKRSVHPETAAAGNRYICNIPACKSKGKIWPRADNFRAHLKRVHQNEVTDDELEKYVMPKPATPPPAVISDLAREDMSMGFAPPSFPSEAGYVCHMPACKGKVWPGADALRAHFKDAHQDAAPDDELEGNAMSKSVPQLSAVIPGLSRDDINVNFSHNPFAPGASNLSGGYWMAHRGMLELSNDSSPTENLAQNPHASDLLALEDTSNASRFPKPDASVSPLASHGAGRPLDPPKEILQETHEHNVPVDNQYDTVQSMTPSQEDDALHSDSEDSQLKDQSDSVFPPPPEMEDHSENPTSDSREESDVLSIGPDVLDGLKEDKDIDCGMSDSPEPSKQEIVKTGLQSVDLTNQAEILSLLKTLDNNGLLEKYGYRKEPSMEPDAREAAETAAAVPKQEHIHACSQCEKTFGRRCELRKHEKRHVKPYACTFPECTKKFGSKNDWKRHENSQHFQLEVWKCDVQVGQLSTEVCGKVSHRRESFKTHLQTHHSMNDDPQALENKIEACRIGRNYQARFWCGFCATVVATKRGGLDAWNERFDHIDDHFIGKNNVPKKDISQWKNVDPDSPPKSLAAPESDDSDQGAFLPSAAFAETDTEQPEPPTKKAARRLKTRRRDVAGGDGRAPKRRREDPQDCLVFKCCQCGELVSGTVKVCMNHVCQHRVCNECSPSPI